MITAVVILLLLFLIPGYAAWLVWGRELKKQITALEAAFLIFLAGFLIVSWAALVLASFSLFSLVNVTVVVLTVAAGLIFWAARRGLQLNPFRGLPVPVSAPFLFLLLGVLLYLSPQPSEYIVGGRDHGIYVNTGVHIAQTGGILVVDDVLAALPADSQAALIKPDVALNEAGALERQGERGARLPGLILRDLGRGISAPHAFHLYPVLIAIFHAAGGLSMALATTQLLALLGAASFYFAAARLLGRPTALLALLFLVVNIAQVWFTKYPSAEILAQPLFWAGLFAFGLMLSSGSGFAAGLAGLSLGLLLLAKLDTLFVPIILFLFFLFAWLRGRLPANSPVFLACYGALLLHAALHAFFIATIYTLDHMINMLLPPFMAQSLDAAALGQTDPWQIAGRLLSQNLLSLLLAILLAGILIAGGWRFQERLRLSMMRYSPLLVEWLKPALIILLAVVMLYSYLRLDQPAAFAFMDWYLSPFVVLLGGVGLLQFIARSESRYENFAWLMIAGSALPLFALGPGTSPDHFWAIRRFLPVVIPSFILFAAYLLWRLAALRLEKWSSKLLPAGLAAIILVTFWRDTAAITHIVEYNGLAGQVGQLAERFTPETILLFEEADASARIATPLWMIYGRTTFIIQPESRESPGLAQALAIWQAEGRDVYWFSAGGESPPLVGDRPAGYVWTEVIAAPLMETPEHALPRQTGRYIAVFDIHALSLPDAPAAGQRISTVSAAGAPRPLSGEGLYPVERLPGLTPRQWSADQVVIDLPTAGPVETISLIVGNGRPFDPPPEARLYLNETLLGSATVRGLVEIHTFQAPANLSLSETAQLRLETTPWTPALTGHGGDERVLGILLYQIKWVTSHH